MTSNFNLYPNREVSWYVHNKVVTFQSVNFHLSFRYQSIQGNKTVSFNIIQQYGIYFILHLHINHIFSELTVMMI